MNTLNKIEKNFRTMVNIGKVNHSVIEDLKKFKDKLNKSKSQFFGKGDTIKYFPIFHAIETQNRIMDHMIYRVDLAPKIHDNPTVAEDALLIMPHIKLINDSLESDTRFDSHYIMELSSKLQILAMKNKMYPPQNKITKSIDKKGLKINFNRFVDNVGEEIERT